jgi:tetratricopeptide (TPR) repeat protein
VSSRIHLRKLRIQALSAALTVLTVMPVSALSEQPRNWLQLQRAGTDALDGNRYWIAEPTLKQALIEAGNFGMSDMRLAKSLGELGRLYTIRGRFDQAEPYLEEQLHVTQSALGIDSAETIPAMGSLIQFYLRYGTASKAPALTDEMLSFLEGKLNDAQARTGGKIKVKKGVAIEGWVGEAAPLARDPLIEWAIACDAVGDTYLAEEDYERADRCYKAALDLKTMVLGKEHLSLANSYESLGSVCLAQKNEAGAESYLQNALEMTEKILPADSPQVYSRLDKLARCLIKEGKYKDAEALYIRAKDLWKGAPSGNEACALYALGSLYAEEKNYEAAAPALAQALHLSEEINGPASVLLVPYLQRYAYVLYYLKRKPEVEELRARANTISGVMH